MKNWRNNRLIKAGESKRRRQITAEKPITKLELELEKVRLQAEVKKTVIWAIMALMLGYWFFDMLKNVLGTANQLSAFSSVIEKFHAGMIVSLTFNLVIWPSVWHKTWKSRNRAIAQKAHFQKLAESGDPNRSSSEDD